MSEDKTGMETVEEPTVKPNDDDANVVADSDGLENSATNDADIVVPKEEEQKEVAEELSDEEILKKLQGDSDKTEPEKKSRKVKAIERSVRSYNKSIDEEGNLDVDVLLVEYEKNPKGLASFAKNNNYDLDALQELVNEELGVREKESLTKLEELELQILELKESQKSKEISKTINDLVADTGLTLKEFNETYGEDYSLFLSAYKAQGKSEAEAIKLAFAKVAPKDEAKEAMLNTIKKAPAGVKNHNTKEIGMTTLEKYRELPREERIAYLRKYQNEDGTPNVL